MRADDDRGESPADAEGRADALNALFERYRPALEAHARRRIAPGVRRKVSVADVVQETRILAFDRLRDFEPRHDGALRAWLVKVVEYKVREAVRRYVRTAKRAASREVSRGDRADAVDAAGRDRSPSEAAIGNETDAAVRAAMAALAPDYREVLRLVRIEGVTLAQAANRLERTREATKKLYARALVRFTENFRQSVGDGRA